MGSLSLVDTALSGHSQVPRFSSVWGAARTWNDNFGAAPADIVRVAGGAATDQKRV
mgnify:CR=1 FL=1